MSSQIDGVKKDKTGGVHIDVDWSQVGIETRGEETSTKNRNGEEKKNKMREQGRGANRGNRHRSFTHKSFFRGYLGEKDNGGGAYPKVCRNKSRCYFILRAHRQSGVWGR